MISHTTPASVIVFDVNETLLDITILEPLFERIFGDRRVMREWFAQLILYSQTMTLSGRYTPFGELAVGTLKMLASIYGVSVSETDIDELQSRMTTMPAHDDVIPALNILRDAGYRLVTLTNSAKGASPTALERAGIADYFEQCFSVDDIGKFKPEPETYRFVANKMGVEMSDLCLVACHLWDTIGAQSAGSYGALVTRPGNALLSAESVPIPDFSAPTLTELALKIAAP